MAKKPRAKQHVHREPSLTALHGAKLLRDQCDKGKQLLLNRPISSAADQAWETVTRDVLISAFGSDSPNISSVMNVGRYAFGFGGGNEAEWEKQRAKDMETRLQIVDGLIELLDKKADLSKGDSDAKPAVRESSRVERGGESQSKRLKLFICHSSKDERIAGLLIEVIRSSLRLGAKEIRCTSVDGYRLPAGANTVEQLRQEVHDAKAFIGIVSAASLESLYVVFELGARWGAGRHLIPLLAPGTDDSILSEPLSGINALHCDSAPQLHQLVNDLAGVLQLNPERAEVYQSRIDQIVQFSPPAIDSTSTRDRIGPRGNSADSPRTPSKLEFEIMVEVDRQKRATVEHVAINVGITDLKAKFHLDELAHNRRLLAWFGNMNPEGEDHYMLTHEGRRLLVERGG